MTEPSEISGALRGAVSFETAALQTRSPGPGDIDDLGHVNNAVYLVWAQQIAVAHWAKLAGPALIEKHLWVVLRHEIDYREPIVPGDPVEVRTWLGRADGPRFARHIEIRRNGSSRFSARVLSDWCLLDASTRKPMRVTAEILDAFGVSG
ncbi:MAG: thioesterase family protein [Parvularculaceae bacterium]